MKKNIILFISNLKAGGAQRVVSNLTHGLSENYNLKIVVHDGKKVTYPYKGVLIDLGVPVASLGILKIVNIFRRIFRLKKIKQIYEPHAVISFMESSNLINLASGQTGKSIISVRNYKSKQGKSFYSKILEITFRYAYKNADLIVTPSYGIKYDLVNVFDMDPDKISVIYNPIVLNYIHDKSKESYSDNLNNIFKDPVLITAGKLMVQKGQWHLIRALRKIITAIPKMKLVILGEGKLKHYLSKVVIDCGLQGEVFFLGFQDNPFRFFSSSSVFILPSLFEGFPNVLIEAMACGLPVVAADCPSGPREILAPASDFCMQTNKVEFAEHGILIPVCDGNLYSGFEELTKEENVMADAIIKLYHDKKLCDRYKKKGLERVKDFTVEKVAKQWIEIIEH